MNQYQFLTIIGTNILIFLGLMSATIALYLKQNKQLSDNDRAVGVLEGVLLNELKGNFNIRSEKKPKSGRPKGAKNKKGG